MHYDPYCAANRRRGDVNNGTGTTDTVIDGSVAELTAMGFAQVKVDAYEPEGKSGFRYDRGSVVPIGGFSQARPSG
jgi:hypothetical protein